MISVIIPAYNVEKYIDACLRSVVEQKDADYEVVLVNDGSKDGTGIICRKWAAQYENIKYIEQENKGQGTARNVAIEKAEGEWLVFLDADDEMAEGALVALQDYSKEHVNADIIWYEHNLIKNHECSPIAIATDIKDKKQIMLHVTTFLWDKMFRKELWEREEIVLSDLYGEDILPVYALLAKAAAVKVLRKPLIIHYERNDNLSSNATRVLELPMSIRNMLFYFEKKGLFAEYRKELFVLVMRQIHLYRYVIEMNERYTEKVVKDLERIKEAFFQQYEFVLIGREESLEKEIWLFEAYHYECIEKYLIHDIKREGKAFHFIIGVEQEAKDYFCGTRTEEWVCARWKAQCQELLCDIVTKYGTGGTIAVYQSRKTHPIFRRLEQIAAEALQCSIIDDVLDIVNVPERMQENLTNLPEYQAFDFRGEYLRLDYNCNILKRWLEWKMQNVSLEHFFVEKGYKKIAIYGMGYLGMLLWQDLRGTGVAVDYFLERIAKPDCQGLAVYGIEDKCPSVDAIVVSVVHQYDVIKGELAAKREEEGIAIISLEEILEI